ncbi:hypothetical protein [Streptomyces ficellus]|uniref:Uncharacterized protein n=1 Tax=Streptomyces ficellus TaxID=1977088 RepID=A0A6I6FJA4_9ACTN|nr:hypothetical protein [Streptomyces ficellus]QGV78829.1 hypothetical protein EIZ62_11645 [Streptomyces ficellus]
MTTPPGFGPPIPVQPPYGAPPAPYGAPQQPQYGTPQQPHYGAPAGGPEFVAHDRRNSVIVDANGVALEVNGHTMDFPWAGVAAVHHAPSPHGAVLMVTVTHPGGLRYECRVDARRKAQLHQWLAELGPVLHHYLAHRG